SSSRSTLVVRGDNGRVQLFVFDRDTVKPRTLAAGSRVRVSSSPGEESGVRLASEITVLSAAPAATSTTTPPAPEEPVPPQVRKLEREIQRQARRYQAGVSSGVALDPE